MTATAVAPAPVTDTVLMIGRSLRHTTRNLDSLLIGILLPVLLLLLMTTVFGGAIEVGDVGYVDYVVPGVILLCAGYGASTTAVGVTSDMQDGIVDRFRTMNMAPSAVLTGHVVASVARNLVSVLLVVATAMVLGFRPSTGPLSWLGAVGVVVVYILALSWLAAGIGLLARSAESASAFGFFLLFLPYLSSAFVPVHTLPGWLQPVAEHQPFTSVNETMRSLLLGTPAGGYPVIATAWCLGILVVAVAGVGVLWRRARG